MPGSRDTARASTPSHRRRRQREWNADPVRSQALPERTAMTQVEPTSDPARRATARERETTAALVEAQIKIARGLATLGLIAGVAIGLGVPLIVLELRTKLRMDALGGCVRAAVTGLGIIIALDGRGDRRLRCTSRCLGKLVERGWTVLASPSTR